MVQNLLDHLNNVLIKRLHVSFVPKKTNLDSFVGRTAHIYFLDQIAFARMMIHVYKKYFA